TAVGRSAAAAARTRKDGGHGCGTPDACAYLAGSEGARRVVNTLVGLWDGAGVPPRSIVLWRQVRSSLSRVAVASRRASAKNQLTDQLASWPNVANTKFEKFERLIFELAKFEERRR